MTKEEKLEMIQKYKESIKALEEMKAIYEKVYLFGGYYTEMIETIDSQIADCELFIKNIEARLDR